MNRPEVVRLLNEEIERLTRARDLLGGADILKQRGRPPRKANKAARPGQKTHRRPSLRGRRMSPEAKAKIASAAKRRWAKWRKEQRLKAKS
jgi:hypothetical protein